jgi:microcystin-dependent protein
MTDTESNIKDIVKNIYQEDIKILRQLQKWCSDSQEKGIEIKNLNIKKKFNIIQKGMIVAFNGSKVPEGWVLCDGQNGTPDLRGRFIYGFGKNLGLQFGRRGGEETHVLNHNELPSHTHQMNDSGSHSHSINFGKLKAGKHDIMIGKNDGDRLHSLTSNNSGNHSHNIGSSGGNQPHNNMPPYYVFNYIMKL